MSPVTEIWTIGALVGALFSAVGAWDGYADLRITRGIGNGRRTLAVAYLTRQVAFLMLSLTWLAIGLASLSGVLPDYLEILEPSILGPFVIAGLAALDLRSRRGAEHFLAARSNERLDRIEQAVHEGADAAAGAAKRAEMAAREATIKVQEGTDAAKTAYTEANNVNVKIADLKRKVGDEIERTDAHQIVQDERIDNVEKGTS